MIVEINILKSGNVWILKIKKKIINKIAKLYCDKYLYFIIKQSLTGLYEFINTDIVQ